MSQLLTGVEGSNRTDVSSASSLALGSTSWLYCRTPLQYFRSSYRHGWMAPAPPRRETPQNMQPRLDLSTSTEFISSSSQLPPTACFSECSAKHWLPWCLAEGWKDLQGLLFRVVDQMNLAHHLSRRGSNLNLRSLSAELTLPERRARTQIARFEFDLHHLHSLSGLAR
jgi:hypothetical protein